ncbi:GNAT family N-acetyltransferase [Nocardioides halotolerans]|jgi:ribosomal-protein-alanine N-acetyltransferase|uniref:GNAT family N-acetyltransferase n=1 Tax=Nocardioides halotolerans TaxID=433660 RepID=UPI000417E76A|nr:GNAT family N-acetyltransferase [Nocardioides halotolerans]
MPELQPLRADHATAILAFEGENRAFFARSITDRGEEFFEHFDERHRERLAEQVEGTGAYYVLVEDDGSVVGRFNLIIHDQGVAELGYRLAERATGRGLATAAVLEVCAYAAGRHGLTTLRAATSHDNVASQRVLLRAGFVETGPADPSEIGRKQGSWYELDVSRGGAGR